MKIAIIGAGAMGMLFGGYLSLNNEVTMVGRNQTNMELMEKDGIIIKETDGSERTFFPNATVDSAKVGEVDLVVMFVKAGDSNQALKNHKSLIGKNTILMTLQNGSGHEHVMGDYAVQENIIIGTTQQGAYKIAPNCVVHSGGGETAIGAIVGDTNRFLYIANTFLESGFPCKVADKVKGMIWNKLMINASSSVLSGVLQTNQGYVEQNDYAWNLAKKLIQELCAVATAEGYPFDPEEQIARIKKHLQNAPSGYTSIFEDIKNARKTEVDVINGAVVAAGHRLGIPVPTHEYMVELVHAMEGRQK